MTLPWHVLSKDTLTGKTQWTRPGDGAFVIPLGLIQVRRFAWRTTPISAR
jgi:hypothetical protein